MTVTADQIEAGTTYAVTFPRGMHKTDFAKCLQMGRKYGTYDPATRTWEITPQGSHGTAVIREMIDRGATATEA